MPVHRSNLLEVVNRAWQRAIRTPENNTNRQRSQKWVSALAEEFQSEYHDEEIHRVFWQRNKRNREQFGINEFLFDVMVCSVSQLESLQRRSNPLDFIDQCHWQVESEFNRENSRAVIVDMSKLVVGSAENKLFIASHRSSRERDLLNLCARIARRCSGNVFFRICGTPGRLGEQSGGTGVIRVGDGRLDGDGAAIMIVTDHGRQDIGAAGCEGQIFL